MSGQISGLGAAAAQDAPLDFAREDPSRFVGAEACGECHISEFGVWAQTPHATGFKTLHRKESAEAIAGKLGFRLIKRNSLCIRCHYTPAAEDDQLRALSGVSCESCHGAAQAWINVHNNYGGRDLAYGSESAEHRAQRIAESRTAGMRRPSDLYPVAANCFQCHLVPEEELVNIGGHTTGSADFEFVEWSQEKIRHNFLELQRGGIKRNAERSAERKRIMYVVGRALDLEYSLRGVAAASTEGVYVKAMIRRVRNAAAELREIAARTALPSVDEMLSVLRGVDVQLGQTEALLAAADRIGGLSRRVLDQEDGERLANLDPLIEGTSEALAPPAEEVVSGAAVDVADAVAPEAKAADSATPSSVVAAASSDRQGSGGQAAGAGTVQVVGEVRTRVRPWSEHQTVGPGSCGGCHTQQNEWWFAHAHYRSADPFFDQAQKNVQLARLYGIRSSELARGNKICMDCHGTIVSGRESREVLDGVGCESCHGGAKDWLEPHKDETDKQLGRQRPGYIRALQLGKRDLRDLEGRASVCTGCHYITELRLISSGHPAGTDFDYVKGMAEVRHWQQALEDESTLRQAFAAIVGARGPVPDVPVASLVSTPAQPTASAAGSTPVQPPAPTSAENRDRPIDNPSPYLAPAPRPSPLLAEQDRAREGEIELPPFPEIAENASIEEILRLLKQRLELLYQAVAETP